MIKTKRAAIYELEKAMQLTFKIPCDCARLNEPCRGECDGSRIWQAIYNARKFFKNVKLKKVPAHSEGG